MIAKGTKSRNIRKKSCIIRKKCPPKPRVLSITAHHSLYDIRNHEKMRDFDLSAVTDFFAALESVYHAPGLLKSELHSDMP